MDKHLDEFLGFAIVIAQGYAMFLCIQMYSFAKRYSRQWSHAWLALLAIMIMAFVRRALVIGYGFGLNGELGRILKWGTDYLINAAISFLWILFLLLLLRWWNSFFKTYSAGEQKMLDREAAIGIREDAVTKREALLLIDKPNGVKIEEPQKVVIEVAEKTVFAESPKKVTVFNPSSSVEVKK